MRVTTLPIHPSGLEPEGVGQSAGFSNPGIQGVMYIDVTDVAGTDPTLNVVLEAQNPLDGTWHATGDVFAELVAEGQERVELANLPDVIVRAVWTVGGTATPTFTFAVAIVMKEPQ